MNLTKTLLAAGAFAIIGGGAFASTIQVDTLLGAALLPNSGDGTETTAMCDAIEGDADGMCGFDLVISDKPLEGLEIYFDHDGIYYVDLADDLSAHLSPGWFLLKFGKAGDSIFTHFFFENLTELSILAWDIEDNSFFGTELAKAWHDCVAGDEVGDDCTLSHITTFVPIPAAGFLLIAGLGGLLALRRRKS